MRIASLVATGLALSVPAHAQVISRVSHDANGVEGNDHSGIVMVYEQRTVDISSDGNVVAFTSAASNLVPGDTNGVIDIFVFDRVAGTLERVSVDSAGVESDADAYSPRLSSDGRIVAFWSRATNLVANDTNGAEDTFLHDRSTGITERVSVNTAGVEGDLGSYRAALSSDGMLVAFESNATNLAVVDTNKSTDIFLRDRAAGTTRRVSLTSSGTPPDPGGCFNPDMSADGRYVVFSSRATNLVYGDTNGISDIFARDTVAKTTTRVSVDSNGAQADLGSTVPRISGDGSTVAFQSDARNLVAGDTNWAGDVFVHELASGLTERVSVDSSGAEADATSGGPALSADGRVVVFSSDATNLAPNDGNGAQDVYLRDRAAGTTMLVSSDYAGAPGNDWSTLGVVSGDATNVAFASVATDLVANDTNGSCDVFFDDLTAPRTLAAWSNYGAGFPGTLFVPSLASSANPVLGTTITLTFDDSAGVATTAFTLLGAQSASIPTLLGGTLLVQPGLVVPSSLPPSGGSMTGTVPGDPSLFGVSLFVQVLELDAGAAHGVSFTPGLELDFGI